MAIVQMEGFDHSLVHPAYSSSNVIFSSFSRKNIGYSYQRQQSASTSKWEIERAEDTVQFGADIGLSFYFYLIATTGTSDTSFVWIKTTGGTNLIRMELNSSYQFRLVGSTTSSYGSAVSTGAWHRAWLRGTQGGTFSLDIDGASYTSASTTSVGAGVVAFGGFASGTVNTYIDDVIITDNTSAIPDYVVRSVGIGGQGSDTGWTGSYTDVDDSSPDDDTTYISTDTNNAVESFTIQSISSLGIAGVYAYKPLIYARSTGATSQGSVFFMRNNASHKARDVSATSYTQYAVVYDNLSVISDFQTSHFGVQKNGSSSPVFVRITFMLIQFAGPPAISQSAAGSIATLSGAVSRFPRKSVIGTITQAGTLIANKKTVTSLVGTVGALTGAVSYSFVKIKSLTGALSTLAGNIPARKTLKSLSGPIGPAAAITKKISTSITGSTGVFSGIFQSSRLRFKALAGTVGVISGNMSTFLTKYKYAIMKAGKVIINYMKGGNA